MTTGVWFRLGGSVVCPDLPLSVKFHSRLLNLKNPCSLQAPSQEERLILQSLNILPTPSPGAPAWRDFCFVWW